MRFYDITRTLGDDTVVWPNDTAFCATKNADINSGSSYNCFQLSMSSHSGTHIDTPYHFHENGRKIDDIDVEALFTRAHVIQISSADSISHTEFLDVQISEGDAVLFKTKNQFFPRDRFYDEFIHLSYETAEYLVKKKISLVGIDYLSIERDRTHAYPIHRLLLENNILILEDIDLFQVMPSEYKLYCFPLKMKGVDASPCRAVLESYNKDNNGK